MMGASTVLWSNTNIEVRLGASRKVVARILQMRKLRSGTILLLAKCSSSYRYTLNFRPPFSPDVSSQSLQLLNIAVCGWLHMQLHTPFYLPYLSYRVALPRVILCTHYIISSQLGE